MSTSLEGASTGCRVAQRVLVVTSRTGFAEALSVALRASDLDFVGARRTADAVRTIEDDLPGAVIVDLLSPLGSQEPITAAVRARPQGADVPIIFCGDGRQAIKSTTDSLIAGGDGYFNLPAEAQRVVAKIATYLGCPVPELPASLSLPGDDGSGDEDPAPPSDMAETTAPVHAPRPITILESAESGEMDEATDALAMEAVEAAIAAARTRSGEGATVDDGPADAAREDAASDELLRAGREAAEHEAAERAAAERAAAERAAAEEERRIAEEQRRRAEEQSRIAEQQRQAVLAQSRRAEEQRQAAEARRAQAERDAAEAEALAAARQAEADRQQAELARLDAEAGERLRQLDLKRQKAEDAARLAGEGAARAAQEAAERELRERAQLEELERQRKQAEADARRATEQAAEQEREGQRKVAEMLLAEERERARLEELQRRRGAIEEEAARALEELGQKRAEAQDAARRMAAEAAEREEQLRGRLEELEAERVRREGELERTQHARNQREAEERIRLEELEAERHRQEERARLEADELMRRELMEQERLAALEDERVRREEELREALQAQQAELAAEEERLARLKSEVASVAERERQRAEERARLEADAELRLAEARRQREQLEQDAASELERLRKLRAEEELARLELDEKRARARLAFQTGRLDAVPPGDRAAGTDVGSRLRPGSDAEGQVVGGPLLPFLPLDAEPPPPPKMVPLEPPAGRFADGELPSLLWACANLKVTGVVELTFDDGRSRSLYLEEGEPVLVASTLPADRPEEGLLRAGLITAARYNELRAGPLRSPRRTASALVAEGVLKPEELFPAVRGVLTEQVLSLLEHDAGAFSYREELAHAADRVRLEHPLDALLAEGIRRKFDERRLWLVLGGPSSLAAPEDRARELPPLSPEEKLVLVRLDGTRSLEDVIVETAISVAVVLRAALIAISCGAARLLARGVPADPAERAAQRERSLAIDKARVLDRLHAARHGDYFSFLGVDVHASAFEVQRAAERLRQRFDPQRFPDPAFAEVQAALKEIVEVSYDAEAVLGDATLAESYRRNLLGGAPRLQQRRRA